MYESNLTEVGFRNEHDLLLKIIKLTETGN